MWLGIAKTKEEAEIMARKDMLKEKFIPEEFKLEAVRGICVFKQEEMLDIDQRLELMEKIIKTKDVVFFEQSSRFLKLPEIKFLKTKLDEKSN